MLLKSFFLFPTETLYLEAKYYVLHSWTLPVSVFSVKYLNGVYYYYYYYYYYYHYLSNADEIYIFFILITFLLKYCY